MRRNLVILLASLALAPLGCGGDTGDGDPSQDASQDDAETGGAGDATQPDVQHPDIPDRTEDVPKCKSNAECDDGLYCTGEETCSPDALEAGFDGCVPGEPPKGNDPDPTDCVTLGPCDEDAQGFPTITLGEGDACDDGIACSVGDVCLADGTCKGTADDARCNDELFCNGVESCNTQVGCVVGDPPVAVDEDTTDCLVPGPCDESTHKHTLIPAPVGQACDDGIDCTTPDACTGAGTCEGKPNHGPCGDGVFCNGAEECVVGVGCSEGVPPGPGADETPDDCTIFGACDEETDSFPLIPAGLGETCSDGVECTTDDACDGKGGCAGVPQSALCADGLYCNGAEECDAELGCQSGEPPVPPEDADPDDCMVHSDECDEQLDMFVLVPAEAGATCNDGVECTTDDACNEEAACVGKPDDTLCDDEKFCNGAETCDPELDCQDGDAPEPPEDTNLLDCYAPDMVCHDDEGGFPILPVGAGTACDDGTACTQNDICDVGGTCLGQPDHDTCQDESVCNGKELCVPDEGCKPGTPATPPQDDPTDCLIPAAECTEEAGGYAMLAVEVGTDCDDGIACTTDSKCAAGGKCIGVPNDESCANELFCDGEEVCDTTLGCIAGELPTPPEDVIENDCLVPGPCQEDGEEHFPLVALDDGTECDDTSACTSDDKCDSGVCLGTAKVCPDPTEACQAAYCDPTNGDCGSQAVEDGTPCAAPGSELNEQCVDGACVCVPDCEGKACDDPDGCGGTCTDACAT